MSEPTREIKFRAISNEDGQFIVDDLYWFEENGVHDFNGKGHWTQYKFQQFTGMYDVEGKEIYEGDTLISQKPLKHKSDTRMTYTVIYEAPSYKLISDSGLNYVLSKHYIRDWKLTLSNPVEVDPKALDIPLWGSSKLTVRQFLKQCLLNLWKDTDSFSGKKPLGDSDWDANIIYGLINAGFIPGTIFEDGDATFDQKFADEYIRILIEEHLLKEPTE